MRRLRELVHAVARLPRGSCAACGARRAAPLCRECCAASGIPDGPFAVTLGSHALYFVGAYREGGRLSPLGRSLRAFKDHGDRYAGRCLASLFAARCAALAEGRDVLVPVPPDLSRLRARGLSPAAWLARALARSSAVPLCTSALRRSAGRPPQRGLGGRARRSNAHGAFELGARSLRGYSVLLTDDVVTTGATLRDATRCLLEAGAAEVAFAVLACADEEMIEACRWKTGSDGSGATGAPRR